jgi:hypothetical protein
MRTSQTLGAKWSPVRPGSNRTCGRSDACLFAASNQVERRFGVFVGKCRSAQNSPPNCAQHVISPKTFLSAQPDPAPIKIFNRRLLFKLSKIEHRRRLTKSRQCCFSGVNVALSGGQFHKNFWPRGGILPTALQSQLLISTGAPTTKVLRQPNRRPGSLCSPSCRRLGLSF